MSQRHLDIGRVNLKLIKLNNETTNCSKEEKEDPFLDSFMKSSFH